VGGRAGGRAGGTGGDCVRGELVVFSTVYIYCQSNERMHA